MSLQNKLESLIKDYDSTNSEKTLSSIYNILLRMSHKNCTEFYPGLPLHSYEEVSQKIASDCIIKDILKGREIISWDFYLKAICRKEVAFWIKMNMYNSCQEIAKRHVEFEENNHLLSNDPLKIVASQDLFRNMVKDIQLMMQSISYDENKVKYFKRIIINNVNKKPLSFDSYKNPAIRNTLKAKLHIRLIESKIKKLSIELKTL